MHYQFSYNLISIFNFCAFLILLDVEFMSPVNKIAHSFHFVVSLYCGCALSHSVFVLKLVQSPGEPVNITLIISFFSLFFLRSLVLNSAFLESKRDHSLAASQYLE
mgnify:CR=1 FL=1